MLQVIIEHSTPPQQNEVVSRDLFIDIDRKTRSTGRTNLLIQLDRIPDPLVGVRGAVDADAVARAAEHACSHLEGILGELEGEGA